MSRSFGWLVLFVLISFGCSGSSGTTSENESQNQTTADADNAGSQSSADVAKNPQQQSQNGELDKEIPKLENIWPKPLAAPRKSMKGNWAIYLGNETPVSLLKIEGEPLTAKVIDTPQQIGTSSVDSAEVTGTSAKVVVKFESSSLPFSQIDFQGDLKNGTVHGNVLLHLPDGPRCFPARLIATDDNKFPTTLQPKTDPSLEVMEQAYQKFQSDGSLELLREFFNDHPESPLALIANRIVLSRVKAEGLNAEEVEKIATSYLELAKRWGPRQETFASLEIGGMLAVSRYLPETALKYLEQTEKRFTDDLPPEWKNSLDTAKKEVLITQSITGLSHKDEQERQKAAEEIHRIQKQQPYHHRVLFALADYAEKQNQLDEAMKWYAQLAVIPSLSQILEAEWNADDVEHPLPHESVAELWKQKHGNSDGLAPFLDQVYEDTVFGFVPEKPDPKSLGEGNQVVLCELFTGAMCGPCVAADIATGVTQKTYPHAKVIVLRYHQHIPGPDQLANQDSEARFGYYNLTGTPFVFLNGKIYPNVAGPIFNAENVFKNLSEAIDPILKEKSDISLKLSATADGKTLNISAEVIGLENPAENLSLRLVLAEEEIHFPARNGIRIHKMIVRSMPGGVRGIKPKNGKLQYAETIQAKDFKQRLMDYLAAYEEGTNWTFPVKPLELKKLHLVAFVQDDSTRDVLQAAALPVTGILKYPQDKKPAATKPKEGTNSSEKPAEALKPVK